MSKVTEHDGAGSVDNTPGRASPVAITSAPAENRVDTITVSIPASLADGCRSYP
jgi:hypothetical protein